MKRKPTTDKDLRLIATNDSGEEPRQDLARELLATRRALRAYLRHAGPGMTLDVSLVLDNAARRVLPEFPAGVPRGEVMSDKCSGKCWCGGICTRYVDDEHGAHERDCSCCDEHDQLSRSAWKERAERAEDKLVTAAMEARANASAEHWMDRAMKAEAREEKAEAKAAQYEKDWYAAKSEFGDAAAKLRTRIRELEDEQRHLDAERAQSEERRVLLNRERACRKRLAEVSQTAIPFLRSGHLGACSMWGDRVVPGVAAPSGTCDCGTAARAADIDAALAESAALDAEEPKP